MKKRIISFILTAVMLLGMVIIPAAAASTPFKDVKEGKWYTEPIKYVYDNKLMNGMTDTTFEPDTPMNRAMLVTVLYRSEGEPATTGKTPFTDLKAGWYKKSVAWAYENKVVNGTTDTTFSPTTPITREQIATIFFRFAQFKGRDISARANLNTFPDGSKVAKYAKEAMTWAVAEGLITGTKAGSQTLLDPKGNATRAQVATILMRYLTATPKTFEERIEDRISELLCYNHDDINLQFGYSRTLTEESLNALLSEIFGCKVEVDPDGYAELKETYSGADAGIDGGVCWIDDCPVTFTDENTGETYTENLGLTLRKDLYAYDTGASTGGVLTWCPDDRPDEISFALYDLLEYDGETLTLEGDQANIEYVESFFREVTGLKDKKTYKFFSTGFGPDEITVCFRYDDPETGRMYTVGAKVNVQVPLNDLIDELLSEVACVTHNHVYFIFGLSSSFNEETLNAVISEKFGCNAEVVDGYDDLKEQYGPAGALDIFGGFVEVEFTRGEESYTVEFYLAVIKQPFLGYTGAMAGGAPSYCWDDTPPELKEAKNVIEYYDDTPITLTAEQLNVEYIESFLREETGLTDSVYQFYTDLFDNDLSDNKILICFKYVDPDTGLVYAIGAGIDLVVE